MYLPPLFREDDPARCAELIRAHPLATLVSQGPGGLQANLVPFLFYPDDGPHGTLRAHLARPNPQLAELAAQPDSLVVFRGPEAYITPAWYPGKRTTGKVVPTWNFATVHAWGPARLVDDPAWLLRLVTDLTNQQEAARPTPWHVDDAPADYISAQLKAIVGLEIPVQRLEGKWKMSQNRSPADRQGVVDGLWDAGEHAVAEAVARRMRGE